jgi:integrator complex subunit 3
LDLGRDFIRAIQDVTKITEFDSLWRDMVKIPERLSPRFKSIEEQLMSKPTPIEILSSRLTPGMELKLYGLLDSVPRECGWTFWYRFKKKFLGTSEAEWLIPDIIRYLLSLELRREVVDDAKHIQRWELIRNLFQSIRNELVAQNAKLALFYDWIFYNPKFDHCYRLGIQIYILVWNCTLKISPKRTRSQNHGSLRKSQRNGLHHIYSA